MFRIEEFSKIAQVPGSLLRYYDQIGLLKPAHIDQWTGYRHYSAKQLPRWPKNSLSNSSRGIEARLILVSGSVALTP